MKFIHVSDLHIGIKLKNYDLMEEQRHVFRQMISYAGEKKPDAFIIAGDVFDKAMPSGEAVSFFDWFISSLKTAVPEMKIMMISGNHDSAPRVNLYRSLLDNQGIYAIGNPPAKADEFIEKVVLKDEFGNVNFYLLPFVKPSMVSEIVGRKENGDNFSYDIVLHRLIERENINSSERNVLVSHQFYMPSGESANNFEEMDSEIHLAGNVDEVKADVLNAFDYAALGHIHKPWKLGDEYHRYCGTPYTYSISESGQNKAAVLVTMNEKGSIDTELLPLEPLHRVRIVKGRYEDVIKNPSEDYIRLDLTDKLEGSSIDMNERIREAFPNLLEIRRENQLTVDYDIDYERQAQLDPLGLCLEFLSDCDNEDRKILEDVFDKIQYKEN